MSRSTPLLIFDGDCGYCRYSMEYARRLTGDAVGYAPYQHVLAEFPQLTETDCRAAIQYVDTDGTIVSGAHAAFRTLAHTRGHGFWLWLYRHVPGFAWVAELKYRFVSRHRDTAMRVSRVLWGREWVPPEYTSTSWLFLRLLAIVYLVAFVSWGVQWPGLIGNDGILPVGDFFYAVDQQLGAEKYWIVPSLLWLSPTDTAVAIMTWGGAALSVALLFNIATRLCLPALWLLYLALYYGGQHFMSYQWDLFLLETGFLAIFLPRHPRLGVWLIRWLMFRFMFLSGAVKLLSGDPVWADLTALEYHYQTQPLPTILAWYAQQLPAWFHKASVAAVFFIELVVPFLIFLPRRIRFFAAWNFIILELLILLTGNYNFFNLLTIFLCLLLFDDHAVRWLLPRRWRELSHDRAAGAGRFVAATVAGMLLTLSALQLWSVFGRVPDTVLSVVRWTAPPHVVNTYGLFAVMTTRRPEIEVQGSEDGETWKAYGFRYKPGPLDRAPRWTTPHQPRLDWQMWFAALGNYRRNPWFTNFMVALGEGSEDVLALLGHNPFPDRPPRYLRAVLYNYRFTDHTTRAATGNWWSREMDAMYFPVILSPRDRAAEQTID